LTEGLAERIIWSVTGIVARDVEIVAVAGRDGLCVSCVGSERWLAELMSVAAVAALGALDAAAEMRNGRVSFVDVELENGGHVVIAPIGGAVLVARTRPNPNLGLVRIALRSIQI